MGFMERFAAYLYQQDWMWWTQDGMLFWSNISAVVIFVMVAIFWALGLISIKKGDPMLVFGILALVLMVALNGIYFFT